MHRKIIISGNKYKTFCTMESAFWLLHWPWLKLPQVPWGVPKLANFMEEMTWLGDGHSRESTGPVFCMFESELHISIGGGWDSDTWEHKDSICFDANDNRVGSLPISSKSTKVLPVGFNHDRGTWYLRVRKMRYKDFGNNSEALASSCDNLQCLWWFATVFKAFVCAIGSFVIARCSTLTGGSIRWPITANALSVYPCLTFSKPCEV